MLFFLNVFSKSVRDRKNQGTHLISKWKGSIKYLYKYLFSIYFNKIYLFESKGYFIFLFLKDLKWEKFSLSANIY